MDGSTGGQKKLRLTEIEHLHNQPATNLDTLSQARDIHALNFIDFQKGRKTCRTRCAQNIGSNHVRTKAKQARADEQDFQGKRRSRNIEQPAAARRYYV